jgi:hypothetical protein
MWMWFADLLQCRRHRAQALPAAHQVWGLAVALTVWGGVLQQQLEQQPASTAAAACMMLMTWCLQPVPRMMASFSMTQQVCWAMLLTPCSQPRGAVQAVGVLQRPCMLIHWKI